MEDGRPARPGSISGVAVMNTGTIESIYIAPKATAPTVSVSEVVAIPGVGL
jgi:hypothetical protein